MGRTDNWGEEPLKRAKRLIEFLVPYSNLEGDSLFVEWQKKDSARPELKIETKLKDLAWLLNGDRNRSKYTPQLEKEKIEVQNTIDRLKELGIVRENSTKSQKSKGIRCFTFILWHSSSLQENRTHLELTWQNRPKSGKTTVEESATTNNQQTLVAPERELNPQLEEILRLYLAKSFDDDEFAELDQAGETDPDRRTLLKQVFCRS